MRVHLQVHLSSITKFFFIAHPYLTWHGAYVQAVNVIITVALSDLENKTKQNKKELTGRSGREK